MVTFVDLHGILMFFFSEWAKQVVVIESIE